MRPLRVKKEENPPHCTSLVFLPLVAALCLGDLNQGLNLGNGRVLTTRPLGNSHLSDFSSTSSDTGHKEVRWGSSNQHTA